MFHFIFKKIVVFCCSTSIVCVCIHIILYLLYILIRNISTTLCTAHVRLYYIVPFVYDIFVPLS